jgi:thiol-disulfide isomerase/thioredoxin
MRAMMSRSLKIGLWRAAFLLAVLFCFGVDAELALARQATIGATGKTGGAPVCEESTATRRFLFRDPGDVEMNEGYHRKMIEGFDGWIVQHPDDVFVQLDRIRFADDKEDRARQIALYKESLEKHPGDSRYRLLYAASLMDTNTPETIMELKKITAGDPMAPFANLKLAEIYGSGKFADRAEARTRLAAFREACPTSLTTWQGRDLTDLSTPEMAAKYAAQIRARLKHERDPVWLTPWKWVWELEFMATPAPQQDALRTKIDAELMQLRKEIRSDDLDWLATVKEGFHLADDKNSLREVEDLILANYPQSHNAKYVRDDRWNAEHPSPKPDATDAEKDAYERAVIARNDELLRKNPADSWALHERFEAMLALERRKEVPLNAGAKTEPDSNSSRPSGRTDYIFPTSEIVNYGERLRTAVQRDTDWFSMPPAEFRIAKAYLDRGVRADEVPGLLEEGLANARKRDAVSISDRYADEMLKSLKLEHEFLTISNADLLVEAARQSSRPEMAKAAMEELAAQNIEEKSFQSRVWKVKAQWAELNGKKLDAMFMYRASIDSRSAGYKPPKGDVDESKEGYERLWKELGGNDDGRQAWLTAVASAQVATDSGWEKATKELPARELPDLQGKTWKLVDFKGKAILINVWATWCGPCRGEHPYLQKFYDKVKDRGDVQVLTFNIDDSAADVGPYMRDNHYTFPVLMAKDLVYEILPTVAIPQNWVVNREGKWEWDEEGFSGAENFERVMMEKLGVR